MEAVMRRHLAAGVVVLLAACGGDEASGPRVEPGLRIVQGREATDTIGTTFAPMIAQLADEAGRPIAGVVVHFTVHAVGQKGVPDNAVFLASDEGIYRETTADVTTDEVGRARVAVLFSERAGQTEVEVTARGESDVAHFTVLPGRPASISLAPTDTTLYVGASAPLRILAADRAGNPVPGTPTLTASEPVLSASPTAVAVVAQAIGRATVRAQVGGVAAQAAVSVVPRGTIAAAHWDGQMNDAIVTMELDGSGVTPLYAPGGGTYGEWLPAWSPDARQLAFVGRYADNVLHVVTPPGAPQRPVDEWITRTHHAPSYSPDGAWIYFAGHPGAYGDMLLWRVHPDGTGLDSLTGYDGTPSGPTDDWPSPSPDGSRLAFISNRAGGARIHLLNLATGVTQATAIAALSVRWAPSGETLAYVAGGGTAIHVVQADGSGDRTIYSSASWIETGFGWSPDGQWLIARTAGRITLIRVADGLALPLAFSSAYHEPSWRPTVR